MFQYFEALADLIKQGIEIANKDLEKESQDKLQQEVKTYLYHIVYK